MESGHIVDIREPQKPFSEASRRNRISSLIAQIKDEFEQHFDRSWLAVVIDDLPLEPRTVREIREFLALADLTPESESRLTAGIDELRRYIQILRTHLVPHAKELLGVSGFSPGRRTMDKAQYVLRRLTAHALPHNLERLEVLVDELDDVVRVT